MLNGHGRKTGASEASGVLRGTRKTPGKQERESLNFYRAHNHCGVFPQLWYEEWSIRQGYFQNFITRIVGKLGVTFPIAGIRPLKAVHLAQNAVRGNRLPTAGRL